MKKGHPIRCAHCGALTRYDMPCTCGYGTVLCPRCERPMVKHARCEPCAREEELKGSEKPESSGPVSGVEEAPATATVCIAGVSGATIGEDEEAPDGDRKCS